MTQQIKGYRNLTEKEIALMNEGKDLAILVGNWIAKLDGEDEIDKRWLAIGKTDLQKGFMSAIRSIAKPTTF